MKQNLIFFSQKRPFLKLLSGHFYSWMFCFLELFPRLKHFRLRFPNFQSSPYCILTTITWEFSLIYLILCTISHWPLHPSHTWDFVPVFNHSPADKSAGLKSSSSVADQFSRNTFQMNVLRKSEVWHCGKQNWSAWKVLFILQKGHNLRRLRNYQFFGVMKGFILGNFW